eukprot:2440496-Pyramimonas_sp.AAC.1
MRHMQGFIPIEAGPASGMEIEQMGDPSPSRIPTLDGSATSFKPATWTAGKKEEEAPRKPKQYNIAKDHICHDLQTEYHHELYE